MTANGAAPTPFVFGVKSGVAELPDSQPENMFGEGKVAGTPQKASATPRGGTSQRKTLTARRQLPRATPQAQQANTHTFTATKTGSFAGAGLFAPPTANPPLNPEQTTRVFPETPSTFTFGTGSKPTVFEPCKSAHATTATKVKSEQGPAQTTTSSHTSSIQTAFANTTPPLFTFGKQPDGAEQKAADGLKPTFGFGFGFTGRSTSASGEAPKFGANGPTTAHAKTEQPPPSNRAAEGLQGDQERKKHDQQQANIEKETDGKDDDDEWEDVDDSPGDNARREGEGEEGDSAFDLSDDDDQYLFDEDDDDFEDDGSLDYSSDDLFPSVKVPTSNDASRFAADAPAGGKGAVEMFEQEEILDLQKRFTQTMVFSFETPNSTSATAGRAYPPNRDENEPASTPFKAPAAPINTPTRAPQTQPFENTNTPSTKTAFPTTTNTITFGQAVPSIGFTFRAPDPVSTPKPPHVPSKPTQQLQPSSAAPSVPHTPAWRSEKQENSPETTPPPTTPSATASFVFGAPKQSTFSFQPHTPAPAQTPQQQTRQTPAFGTLPTAFSFGHRQNNPTFAFSGASATKEGLFAFGAGSKQGETPGFVSGWASATRASPQSPTAMDCDSPLPPPPESPFPPTPFPTRTQAQAHTTDISNEDTPSVPSSDNIFDIPTPTVTPAGARTRTSAGRTPRHQRSAERDLEEKWSVQARKKAEEYRLKGNKAFAEGCYADAIADFTEGIDTYMCTKKCARQHFEMEEKLKSPIHTQKAVYYSNRAQCHVKLGNFQAALNDWNQALEQDPHFVKAHICKAMVYIRTGRFNMAKTSHEDATGTFEEMTKRLSSEEVEGLGKHKDSLAASKSLLDRVLGAVEHLNQTEMTEDFTSALAVVDQLMVECSGFVELAAKKSLYLRKLNRYDDAVAFATEMVARFPSNEMIGREHVMALYYSGDIENALAAARNLPTRTTASPADKAFRKMLVQMQHLINGRAQGNELHRKMRFREACAKYTEALTYAQDNDRFRSILLSNRAASYQMLGDSRKALEDCLNAVAANKDYKKARIRLAKTYVLNNQVEDGMKLFDEMIKEDPTDAEVKQEYEKSKLEAEKLRATDRERKIRELEALSHYQILDIPFQCMWQADTRGRDTATEEEIRKAYRNMARKWHPDKHPTHCVVKQFETDARFKRIQEAYRVLSNASTRRDYDHSRTSRRRTSYDSYGAGNPFSGFSGFTFTRPSPNRYNTGASPNSGGRSSGTGTAYGQSRNTNAGAGSRGTGNDFRYTYNTGGSGNKGTGTGRSYW